MKLLKGFSVCGVKKILTVVKGQKGGEKRTCLYCKRLIILSAVLKGGGANECVGSKNKTDEPVLIRKNPGTEILLPPEKNQLVSHSEILTES